MKKSLENLKSKFGQFELSKEQLQQIKGAGCCTQGCRLACGDQPPENCYAGCEIRCIMEGYDIR